MHIKIDSVAHRGLAFLGHEHQRGREFDRRRDEARHESGQHAARHERNDNAAYRAQAARPEGLRRLLERDRDLLQRGHTGAQRVGQASHSVGDHDQHPGRGDRNIGTRHEHAAKRAQIPDGQHQPGDGKGRGGDPVEPLPAWQARAQHDVGDRGAKDHIHPRSQTAIEHRVGDHAARMLEDACIVRKGEAVRQRRVTPHARKREQQNPDVRRKHQHQHQDDPAISHHAFPGT